MLLGVNLLVCICPNYFSDPEVVRIWIDVGGFFDIFQFIIDGRESETVWCVDISETALCATLKGRFKTLRMNI